MSRPRLSDVQRRALYRLSPTLWRGARDAGVEGSTIAALERKGLARAAWAMRPYRHVVGRLTRAGVELARELQLDDLERRFRAGAEEKRPANAVELWLAGRITDDELADAQARYAALVDRQHRDAVLDVLLIDVLEGLGPEGATRAELEGLIAGADYTLRDGELDAALERGTARIVNRRHADRITARTYTETQEISA